MRRNWIARFTQRGKKCRDALQSRARVKTMTKAGGASSLVRVFDQVAPSLSEFDRDNFFEVAYEHFAEAGVWELYPEVPEALQQSATTLSTRRDLEL